ncbi:hypothetical protein D3C84_1092130 [compost metagenome]
MRGHDEQPGGEPGNGHRHDADGQPDPGQGAQQAGIDEQHHLDAVATVQQQAAEQRAKRSADVEQHLHQAGLGFAEALFQQQRR